MDKKDLLIINAYALEAAGISGKEELEKYLNEVLNLEEGYLESQYNLITYKINEEGFMDSEAFRWRIYEGYLALLTKLALSAEKGG